MTPDRPTTVLTSALAACACAVLVAACAPAAGTSAPAAAPSAQPGAAGGGPGAGGTPGRTSGLIAEVDGKTFQVQTGSEQVAVSYTAKTAFTERVSAKVADVRSGSCVIVRTADEPGTDGGKVTATAIDASAASGDTCGFGGGPAGSGGGPPSGAPPSGMPSALPSGGPAGGPGGASGGRGAMVAGVVTGVSGGTLTVSAQRQNAPVTYTVATTADTTVSTEQKTTAKAAEVGVCLTARGEPNATGAVTATAITLRKAVNGECTMRGGR